jgi:hypothetical protein
MKPPIYLVAILAAHILPLAADAQDHSGVITILTTPDGADLADGAVVEDFPLLLRLHKDWFDFSQAMPGGEDIRFTDSEGKSLVYQIENWNPDSGEASIWIRIPRIEGNAKLAIKLHWGKPGAVSESSGVAVFNESNGYVSVWHLGDEVKDEAGTLESDDKGTTATAGMIGLARHFPGGAGVFGGDKIPNYPSADSSHTTSLWFRAENTNGTIIGWGNEGGGRGSKIRMQLRSPPHVHIDSDFSDIKGVSQIPLNEWIHVVHTYGNGPRRMFINGQLDVEATTKLDIKIPSRLWLGGWYNNYDFIGDLDEVRISKVARSADWVKLQYENQKPLQTLVGPIIQPGSRIAVDKSECILDEGESTTLTAEAGGAQKIYWILVRDGSEQILAVDRFSLKFDAGRVTGSEKMTLRFKAIYPFGSKSVDVPVIIKETIPDPVFTLKAPANWNGRQTIEVTPEIKSQGTLQTDWSVSGLAVIKEVTSEKMILARAQNSGELTVTLTLSNGGSPVTSSVKIKVQEPQEKDAWIHPIPNKELRPEDNQFYARDDSGEGTLFYRGTFPEKSESVFLKVYANNKPYKQETQKLAVDNTFDFAIKLKAGLITYRIEFGHGDTVLHRAENIVCGDAYIIDGQSNALATDTGEDSPRETNEWIRSYAHPRFFKQDKPENLWSNPVWKAQGNEHKAELGWWGMELAKSLVASQKVPIFMINGAAGGTRIDQHQRDEQNPENIDTIYGRMLWRVRQAGLTHGIRAILWHQGENDQGAAGPDGGFGWESYQRYFVEMSAAWKRDFPNVQRYYVYQIWPNACSMGGGNGDMLREVQRNLSSQFSNMDVLSTVGVIPPGGCHFPLAGWAKFADMVQPLIERDFYGAKFNEPITPPNIRHASFANDAKTEITLTFNQPVIWDDSLITEFYLDGEKEKIASGAVSGNVLTLKLKEPSSAKTITYLKETSWSQDRLLLGTNGMAALTFCNFPIE